MSPAVRWWLVIAAIAVPFGLADDAQENTLTDNGFQSADCQDCQRPEQISNLWAEDSKTEASDNQGNSRQPVFAYFLTGTTHDGPGMVRLLQAVYHPRNEYLLHLERKATPEDRQNLTSFVRGNPVFAKVGNVHIMSQSNLVTYRGVTMVANYLHGAALLLKQRRDWDWFINLSAADYPLMPQDDLLHAFSNISRATNFVAHTSNLKWKVRVRAVPVVLDPALWSTDYAEDVQPTSGSRAVPTSFDIFTGSAWVVLSRAFVEYCIWGLDNVPRLLLLYYANYVSSPEGYFQSVICNSDFRPSVVNSDLHYVQWSIRRSQHPRALTEADFDKMVDQGAPFARKFRPQAPVLDDIDRQLLRRRPGRFTPGAWCAGGREEGEDPCSTVGDPSAFQPGEGAQKLQHLLDRHLRLLERSPPCRPRGKQAQRRAVRNNGG